jgi:Zn-dependent protease with chaperone function
VREAFVLLMLAALVVVPGAAIAWGGRRLRRDTADPLLAERLLAFRGNANAIGAVAIAVVLATAGRDAWWLVPLQILSALAGWFPTRKRLYEETWSLPAYLGFITRVWLGFAGPWILIALTPAAVHSAAHAARWPAAAALLALALAWQFAFAPVLLRLLNAEPLRREDLEARLRAVVERSRAAAPSVFRVEARGGRWANAFALPDTRRPRVVFTATLLDTLGVDELSAIFAHEVAHLEHFDAAWIRRHVAFVTAIAVAAALLVPVLGPRLEDHVTIACWLWAILVLVGLLVRVVRHNEHESHCDRRAAELCGDPEALVRALTRLHTLALLPRRWTKENEEMASHPSLARRIRALRALSVPAPAVEADVALSVPAGNGAWVAFDSERVHWLEGVADGTPADPAAIHAAAASSRGFRYSEFQDLRLDFAKQPPRLRAEDRHGRSWSVTLRAEDVPAVQAVLQKMDVWLAPPARREHRLVSGLVATGTVLAAVHAGSLALALPGLAATIRPDPASLAALGAGGLVHVVFALFTGLRGDGGAAALFLIAVLSILALVLARGTMWRIHAQRVSPVPMTALLAGAALLAWIALIVPMTTTTLAAASRQLALGSSAAVVLSAALAAALACARGPALRALGVLPAVLAALALAANLPLVRRYAADPLELPPAAAVAARPVSVAPSGNEALSGAGADVRLGPGGTSHAVLLAGEDEVSAASIVLNAQRPPLEIEARDVAFLDDSRALVLAPEGRGWRVAEIDRAGADVWSIRLPAAEDPHLSLSRADAAWQVTSAEPARGRVAIWSGRVGEAAMATTHLPLPAGVLFSAHSPSLSLGVRMDWDHVTRYPWLLLATLGATPRMSSELWALEAAGPRLVGRVPAMLRCYEPYSPGQPFLCAGTDTAEGSSALWEIGPTVGTLRALGSFRETVTSAAMSPRGPVVALDGTHALLIDAPTRTARRFAPPSGHHFSQLVAYDAGLAAVAMDERGTARLLLYSETLIAK